MEQLRGGLAAKTAEVCIDSYDGKVMKGRLLTNENGQPETFASTVEFLQLTDSFLGSWYTTCRPEGVQGERQPEQGKGAAATFIVKVLFRQNSSWQGTVSWLEGKSEQRFRSTLELLYLMNDVLEYANPAHIPA